MNNFIKFLHVVYLIGVIFLSFTFPVIVILFFLYQDNLVELVYVFPIPVLYVLLITAVTVCSKKKDEINISNKDKIIIFLPLLFLFFLLFAYKNVATFIVNSQINYKQNNQMKIKNDINILIKKTVEDSSDLESYNCKEDYCQNVYLYTNLTRQELNDAFLDKYKGFMINFIELQKSRKYQNYSITFINNSKSDERKIICSTGASDYSLSYWSIKLNAKQVFFCN